MAMMAREHEEIQEVEPTRFSSLPCHVITDILLRVMMDASGQERLTGLTRLTDLRVLLMDLGSVSRDFKACLGHATALLREINIDQGIDHRRSSGQAIPQCGDLLVSRIGKKCTRLEKLRLRCSEDITEQGMVALTQGCLSTLSKLVILSCNRIGSGRFLSPLTSLCHLELKWAYALLPYHLIPILPNLVVLNLHGCELINDELFLPPPSLLPSRTVADGSNHDRDSRGDKGHVWVSLPLLEELDLAYTQVTGASLNHLSRYAPRLKRLALGAHYFNIITSSRVSEEAEGNFAAARPDVTITHS